MYTKSELITHFYNQYKKYGFKSVTIDNLAGELGISKKTIYENFDNKEEIVERVIYYSINKLKCKIIEASKYNGNAIDRLVSVLCCMLDFLDGISSQFFISLKKYHYHSFLLLQEYRDNEYFEVVRNIISSGIQEGIFRNDVALEYLPYGHINLFSLLIDPIDDSVPRISREGTYLLMLNNIRGMTTMKGFQMLDENYDVYRKCS